MRNFFYRFGIFRFIYRVIFGVRQRTRKSLILLEEMNRNWERFQEESHRSRDELRHEMAQQRQEMERRIAALGERQIERDDFMFQTQKTFQDTITKNLKSEALQSDLRVLRETQLKQIAPQVESLQEQMDKLLAREAERGDFLHQRQVSFEKELHELFLKGRRENSQVQDEIRSYLEKLKADIQKNRPDATLNALKKSIEKIEQRSVEHPKLMAESNRLADYARVFSGSARKLQAIPKLKEAMNDYVMMLEEGDPFRLWDYEISYLDRKALWIQLNELIFREEYFFSEDFEAPHRIIDGGTNIGLSLLFFKAIYPNAEVIGFEPNEDCYNVAMENITRNNLTGVTLIKAALSSETGRQTLFTSAEDSMASSLAPRAITEEMKENSVEVDAVALAEYLDKPVDFLKLDIEGSEAEVMNSVRDKLDAVQNIFCEYHFGKGNTGNNLRDIIDVLDDTGFDYQIAKSVWFGDHSEYRPLQHVGENYSGVVYARKRALMSGAPAEGDLDATSKAV